MDGEAEDDGDEDEMHLQLDTELDEENGET